MQCDDLKEKLMALADRMERLTDAGLSYRKFCGIDDELRTIAASLPDSAQASVTDDELPPMPDIGDRRGEIVGRDGHGWEIYAELPGVEYTEDEMRDYARAALARRSGSSEQDARDAANPRKAIDAILEPYMQGDSRMCPDWAVAVALAMSQHEMPGDAALSTTGAQENEK